MVILLKRPMRITLCLLFIGMSIGHFLIPVQAQGREVVIADLEGVINPPMATYITRVIEDANKSRAAAIILRTDTPGGLDSAMRDIVQSILDSGIIF